jgi:hypothetical protein
MLNNRLCLSRETCKSQGPLYKRLLSEDYTRYPSTSLKFLVTLNHFYAYNKIQMLPAGNFSCSAVMKALEKNQLSMPCAFPLPEKNAKIKI